MFQSQEAKKLFNFLTLIIKKGGTINKKFGLQIDPNAEKQLDFLEDKFKTFSADQAMAIQSALIGNSNVLTICGRAGVGKTYFIKSLRDILDITFLSNVIVCATTGIASQNCGGAGTMHSVFGVGTGNKLPWGEQEEKTEEYKWPRNNAEKVAQKLLGNNSSPLNNQKLNSKLPTYIILDEISMAPSELLHVIYQIALYRHGAGMSAKAASKSVRLICCGDVMQLLPVDKYTDLNGKRKPYVKSREIVNLPWNKAKWDMGDLGTIEEPSLLTEGYSYIDSFETNSLALLENHRQDDKEFIEALNYIRLGGKITEGPGRFLLDRLTSKVEPPEHKDVIHIYYSNNEAFERNRKVLESVPENEKRVYAAEVEYKISSKGKDEVLKGSVESWIPREGKTPPKMLVNGIKQQKTIPADWIPDWANPLEELGLNLPFVVRQNFPEKNIFNGTVGKIVEFKPNSITIELKDGREVDIDRSLCKGVKSDWKGDDEGVYRGLPGHLACGLTGHKCIKHDQLVLTENGYTMIKDVKVNSLVWTGFNWKPVLSKSNMGKQKIYKIETESGYALKCTEDHPIFVANEEQVPTWKSVAEIMESPFHEFACISAKGNVPGNRRPPFIEVIKECKKYNVLVKTSNMTDFKGIYDKIANISCEGKDAEVYDLEVQDDHSFVAYNNPTRKTFVPEDSLVLTSLGSSTVKKVEVRDNIWSGFSWKNLIRKSYVGVYPIWSIFSESGASLQGIPESQILVHKYNEHLSFYKSFKDIYSSNERFYSFICPDNLKELDDLLRRKNISSFEGISIGTDLSSIYEEEKIVEVKASGFSPVYELEIESDQSFVAGDGFIVHNCQGLTINQPLVVHVDPKHARYAAAHWMYVVLSRVVKPHDLYIEGTSSVINQYIKIEESALEFSKQSELNMQDCCKGSLVAESFTPEDVKNQIPVLSSYDLNSEPFRFFFDVFIESDTKISYLAEYSLSEGLVSIYDYDFEEYITPKHFDWYEWTLTKIERFVASLNSTKGDLE